MSSVEVVDFEKEADATGKLVAHSRAVMLAVGAGEQKAGFGVPRSDDHSALRSTVVGRGRRANYTAAAGATEAPTVRRVHLVGDGGEGDRRAALGFHRSTDRRTRDEPPTAAPAGLESDHRRLGAQPEDAEPRSGCP